MFIGATVPLRWQLMPQIYICHLCWSESCDFIQRLKHRASACHTFVFLVLEVMLTCDLCLMFTSFCTCIWQIRLCLAHSNTGTSKSFTLQAICKQCLCAIVLMEQTIRNTKSKIVATSFNLKHKMYHKIEWTKVKILINDNR